MIRHPLEHLAVRRERRVARRAHDENGIAALLTVSGLIERIEKPRIDMTVRADGGARLIALCSKPRKHDRPFVSHDVCR